MKSKRLRIEDLNGGAVVDEVNAALERLVDDLVERPGIASARRVELVVTLQPDKPKEGGADEPLLDVQLKVKLPAKLLVALKGTIEAGQLLLGFDEPAAA